MRHRNAWVLAIALLPILALAAQAQTRDLNLGPDGSSLALVDQTPLSMTYQIQVGELQAMDVETPEGTFTRLSIPGYHFSHEEGAPELP